MKLFKKEKFEYDSPWTPLADTPEDWVDLIFSITKDSNADKRTLQKIVNEVNFFAEQSIKCFNKQTLDS